MIAIQDKLFNLQTDNTSYVFCVNKHNDLQRLYHGKSLQADREAMLPLRTVLLVNGLYVDGDVSYGMDDITYEYSFAQRGDMRDVGLHTEEEGNAVFSFKYHSFSTNEAPAHGGNAHSLGYDDCLKVTLKDEVREVYLHMYYLVYEKTNVISRFSRIENRGNTQLFINKIASAQADYDTAAFKVISFDGAWGRERFKNETEITSGKLSLESFSGASSARHNPYIILAEKNSDNTSGDCYAFNLIYSGNHAESVEVTPYGGTRVLTGIAATGFRWKLGAGESFSTPECVISYSDGGYNGLSRNMHRFINNHIVRGYWKNRVKPVLINSWEAMYFNISREKIERLSSTAAKVGFDIVVVDDGWFGRRNDDTTSLGDWFVNKDKFPDGMRGVSDSVHKMGLSFGLWFEPEMISLQSKLYQTHPEWAFKIDGITQVVGRGQYILNLTLQEVRDYIVDTVSAVISDNGVDYVKWDFNRQFSEIFSKVYPAGEILHRYVLGLYDVQKRITEKCPKVLFELCSAGGNRFDMGMLCFSPIGWPSDNTDVFSRSYIQEGTSYGYPCAVMCNHLSAVPSHMTKRTSEFRDRCNLAAFGVFGVQMDVNVITESERNNLEYLLSEYKQMAEVMQYGDFYRLTDGFENNYNVWQTASADKSSGYVLVHQKLFFPVCTALRFKLYGLDEGTLYDVSEINVEEGRTGYGIRAKGDLLMKYGIALPQNYQGNEMTDRTLNMTDHSTILLKIATVK